MAIVAAFCDALARIPREINDAYRDPVMVQTLVKSARDMVEMEVHQCTTLEELRDWRRQAWDALAIVPSETLSAQNYAPHARKTPPVCLGTVCFLAVMRLTWLRGVAFDGVDNTTSLDDLPFCVRHRLSCADPARPVADYSMSELIACVQALRTGFTQLPFHTDIVALVELCEMVCARMIFETGTSAVFDLHTDGVCFQCADDEYMATGEFHRMMWPSFIGFQRRLLVRRVLPENVDDPPVDHDAMRRLCDWVDQKSREVVYNDASPSLKRFYVRMHLRPGDREIHQMQKPGVTTSEAGVVADTLADTRMAQINPRTNLSPSAGISEHLPRWSYANQPEPMELGFCLYDFFEMVTQGMPGCSWNKHYARPELALEMEEVQRATRDRPMVVQLFTHWQVVFANRIYWFNSAVASITFWLHLMAGAQDGTWTSQSGEFNAARNATIYQELVDVVIRNKRYQGTAALPRDTSSVVYLPAASDVVRD